MFWILQVLRCFGVFYAALLLAFGWILFCLDLCRAVVCWVCGTNCGTFGVRVLSYVSFALRVYLFAAYAPYGVGLGFG